VSDPSRDLVDIEIIGDRTADLGPDEGFLRLQRLTLQNRYADGSTSAAYPCDVVSRERMDAVTIVLYEITPERRVRVALRTGVRPPVYFRKHKRPVQPDAKEHLLLAELVAGLLEPEDTGPGGVERRAVLECMEEAGYRVRPEDIERLGEPLFAGPGTTDENVHYRAARVVLDERGAPQGDGSIMEEAGEVLVLDLVEALARCRDGRNPDSKTEIGLLRLCTHIGYLPQLECFVDELERRR
jgi:ADP-ribose pyrophosphatase